MGAWSKPKNVFVDSAIIMIGITEYRKTFIPNTDNLQNKYDHHNPKHGTAKINEPFESCFTR
jgi:hypothetical protein